MYRIGNGVQLTAMIEPPIAQALRDEAKRRRVSLSQVVREALREHVERAEQADDHRP